MSRPHSNPKPGVARASNDLAARLCAGCGLCCNGVLFGDVEVQRCDDPRRLGLAGLKLFRKGRKRAFTQPCACFDGTHCAIYADRPARCRAFECRVLKRAQAGSLTPAAALKIIQAARRKAEAVLKLAGDPGHHNGGMSLTERCSAALARPVDLAGDESIAQRHSRLLRAAARLAGMLERDFLT
jgi:hypothetical protein